MYQDTRGVQVRDFLEANEARLKDKHFLYVVSTNLEEDTYLRRRNTRGSKDGINVKIGMSQSGVTARLKSYTHMSSNFDPRFPQSGIRVLFLKQFPRRTSGETGSSIVARVETRLKQILREMDRSVDGRGSEVFRIQPEELFQIIEDIGNADASYEPRRQSERFGKNLLWMITDSDTGKQTMMFAEDYDEVLMRFAEDNDVSLLDERSKYITRFYIRRVGSVPRAITPLCGSHVPADDRGFDRQFQRRSTDRGTRGVITQASTGRTQNKHTESSSLGKGYPLSRTCLGPRRARSAATLRRSWYVWA